MESDGHKDRMLLQKLKAEDERAYGRIYDKYHKQLYSVAIRYLRNKKLAEDAVQDIFIKLWNNKKKLDKSGSLRGFLFTAVKNHVLNMISSRKRKLKMHVKLSYEQKRDHKETGNVIVLSQYREVYRKAVRQLPEKRREVFKLKIEDGLTNREVAQYLGISINTVKSQYYKASRFIKAYVRDRVNVKTAS